MAVQWAGCGGITAMFLTLMAALPQSKGRDCCPGLVSPSAQASIRTTGLAC